MTKPQLNPQQLKAVEHDQGPLLIVAGAGTGKTTVITQRVGYLINSGKAQPEEILALTFTDKAAGEMEERVDMLMPYGYVDLWISTFHSFCEKILKQHALDIGIPNDFKLLNTTEQWLLVRHNLEKFSLDYYRPIGNPTKFIHALIKHFSRCKDELVEPKDYLEYAEKLDLGKDDLFTNTHFDTEEAKSQEISRIKELSDAFHTYQNLLLENDALDFGDLINYCLKLFQERPAILEKYRQQFKYILVDEFQDTNYAQYRLVKLLAAPKNNITVVGDDDQAVYIFRGASISNILTFKKDYPKSREIFLNQNYRSCQEILDLSYNFIQQNNPDRLEVKLSQKGKNKLSKKLSSNLKEDCLIEHLQANSLDNEVQSVINKILELKTIETKQNSFSWNDFCILVRANDTASPFIAGLTQAEIPFQFLASRGLYAKPIVLDIIAYLKLLDNYHESTAVWRALNFPVFDISHQELIQISNLARKKAWSLFGTLKFIINTNIVSDKTKEEIRKILNLVDKHTAMIKEKSAGKITLHFLEDSGYLRFLTSKENQQDREKISYLNQFYKEVQQFEQESLDPSIKNFLEELNLILDSGEQGSLTPDWEAGPEAVKIMTVHAAKGLEFKYVFIVSLVDKRFPTTERKEPIELPDPLVKEILPEGDIHLQEERRLFYVAMTRAKKGLFFTSAEDYGRVRKKKVSRFLKELGIKSFTPVDKSNQTTASLLNSVDLNNTRKIDKITKKFKHELPKKFSYSQLRNFKQCPYLYYFSNILKIPVAGKPHFSFGITMHSTLQKFFELARERQCSAQGDLFNSGGNTLKKIKDSVSLEELYELYKKCWVDDWFVSKAQKEEYRKKGKESLKIFYNELSDDQAMPAFLEQNFNIKIGKYFLAGRIDRVDKIGEDEIEIIDYKTGELKSDKLSKEDKEQLLIYQIAAQELFKLNPQKLIYYYLNNNKKVSFLGTPEEIEKLKQDVLATIEAIKKFEFPAKPGHLCKFCDFYGICEYRD